MNYRPEIDGLRAASVIAVLLFHAFPELVPGGFVGVDVFFVISGFLITSIILEGLRKQSFTIAGFYGRRIRRIFPALFLVLATSLAAGWVLLLADEYALLSKHVAGGAAFITNFMFVQESGYFDVASASKPMLHLWSLSIEEQFYLIWPLLITLLYRRFSTASAGATILVLLVTSFIVNVAFADAYPVETFYYPSGRFWELLIGAGLAYLQFRKTTVFSDVFVRVDTRLMPGATAGIVSILGLALILASVLTLDAGRAYPGFWALMPTLGGALVIVSGSHSVLNRVLLANRAMVFVGLISFPLYLWHWPILSFGHILYGAPDAAWKLSALAISFVLATLTYLLVEKRIRYQRLLPAPAIFAAMVVVGFAGGFVFTSGGIVSREINSLNQFEQEPFTLELARQCGLDAEWTEKFVDCYEDKRPPLRFAMVGDSKAGVMFRGVMQSSTPAGRWKMVGGNTKDGGSLVTYDPTTPDLTNTKITKNMLDAVTNDDRIKVVAVVGAARAITDLHNDYSWRGLRDESLDWQSGEAQLGNFVEVLVAAGKKVILVVDNPALGTREGCLNRLVSVPLVGVLQMNKADHNPECSLSLDEYYHLRQRYMDLLDSVRARFPDDVAVLDTAAEVCDLSAKRCTRTVDGRPAFVFTDHMSYHLAQKIGVKLNALASEL